MKGKIILQPIANPVEGMQVVMIKQSGEVEGYGNIIEVATQPEQKDYHDVEISGKRYIASQHLLKQIVVEYEEKVSKTSGFWEEFFEKVLETFEKALETLCNYDIKTLPLQHDQWPVAIALIGHEVNFEIQDYSLGKVVQSGGIYTRKVNIGQYAKLLLPTPVEETWDDIEGELMDWCHKQDDFPITPKKVFDWFRENYNLPSKKLIDK